MNKEKKSNIHTYNKKQRKNYFETLIREIEDNKVALSNEDKKMIFCDVLNYNELKKLIKSLNKFKRKDFVKSIKIYSDIQQIMPIMGSPLKHFTICNIQFSLNFFVTELNIEVVQINSYAFSILYEVFYIENIETAIKFVKKFVKYSYKLRYILGWYKFTIEYQKKEGKIDYQFFLKHSFEDVICKILQTFIFIYCYTYLGKKYILPNFKYCIVDKCEYSNLNCLYKSEDLSHKLQVFIVDDFVIKKGIEITVYVMKENSDNIIDISTVFLQYGNGLYYFLFYFIEKQELNEKIQKYFSNEKVIKQKDYDWLINKIITLQEHDNPQYYTYKAKGYRHDMNKDLVYKQNGNKIYKLSKIFNKRIKEFIDLYNIYYKYIEIRTNIRNNYISKLVSILSCVVAALAFVITIITFILQLID